MGIEWPRTSAERRLALIMAGFTLAGIFIVLQLFRIQLLEHEPLTALAQANQLRREVLEPERGRIFDRDGRLLAFTSENVSLYARRAQVTEPRAVASALDSLGVPAATTRRRLEGTGFVWLTRRHHSEARLASIAERFEGVYTERETKRVEPLGPLARHALGRWSEEPELTTGLELRYTEELTGEPGWESQVVDAVGNRYATGAGRAPRPGLDLVLTLDTRMQEAAEEALADCVRERDAAGGVVLVIDPWTGDVLAMASHGSREEGPGARNRAALDAIEVGSCAKTFVVAAALEEAGCEITTPFYCGIKPGEEDPPVVRDDHGKPGWYSLMMVIAESRNTGTARIARVVGEDRLYRFLSRFGFGRPTGIDLPSESSGVLRPVDEWSGRSLETVAIGYEFSATPLQLAMAYAAVANGGRLMRPRLVRAFVDAESGRSRSVKPEVVRRVVSTETSEALREVLRRVALPGGTGTSANVVGTTIAGKTGTARKFDREKGTYSYERHTSSFIGFAPHDAPRYVCAVIIDEPRGAYYGSEVAAPVFRRVMEKIVALDPEGGRTDVRSLSVSLSDDASEIRPGDVHAAPATGGALDCPDLRGLTTLEARRLAARRGYRLEVLGGGERVLFQEPTRAGRLIVVATDDEVPRHVVVPDVCGLGLREAITRLGSLGLDVERSGTGRVVRQIPAADTEVEGGARIELVLEDAERSWNIPGWSS